MAVVLVITYIFYETFAQLLNEQNDLVYVVVSCCNGNHFLFDLFVCHFVTAIVYLCYDDIYRTFIESTGLGGDKYVYYN